MTDDDTPAPPDSFGDAHSLHHIIDLPELAPQHYDSEGFAAISTHMGIEWRWNVRSRHVEWRSATADDAIWADATDRRVAWFRDNGRRFYTTVNTRGIQPWKPADTEFKTMFLAHLNGREFDPFQDWLETLPEWDGHDRAETLLTRLFAVADTELHRWASRYPLLAAVERTYAPGTKIREHPVLFGPQDIGKSTVYSHLLPARARNDWFGDHLELDSSGKEQAEALAGRVIVEIAELTGTRRADIEKIKGFLSRFNDGQHRGAYAVHAEKAPRRCAIVMTANPDMIRLPNDPSGNTRFVSVICQPPGRDIEPILDRERHQLWAETLHKHRNGTWATARLPRHLGLERDRINEEMRSSDDAFEDKIVQLRSNEPATLTAIAAAISVNLTSNGARLQTALRNHGWLHDPKQVRRNGKRVRLWHPPVNQPAVDEAKYVVGMTAWQKQIRDDGGDSEIDF